MPLSEKKRAAIAAMAENIAKRQELAEPEDISFEDWKEKHSGEYELIVSVGNTPEHVENQFKVSGTNAMNTLLCEARIRLDNRADKTIWLKNGGFFRFDRESSPSN